MRSIIATAAAAIFIAGPVYAVQTTEEASAENAEHNPAAEIICRRQPAPTGSRIGSRRICKTQAEWDAINRDTRSVVEEAQNRSKYFVN